MKCYSNKAKPINPRYASCNKYPVKVCLTKEMDCHSVASKNAMFIAIILLRFDKPFQVLAFHNFSKSSFAQRFTQFI